MRPVIKLAAVLSTLLLAACAAEPASTQANPAQTAAGGGSSAAAPAATIKVGVLPVADFAPVYIAQDKGYFEAEGLKVETQVMQNAAAIAPSVMNGQLQFGVGAVTPLIAAVEKGLPLKAVANMADTAKDADTDPSALLAGADSGIASPKDLEGKKIAVNGIGAIPHIAAAQAIADDGGDPSKATFVAMPFPDMMPALQQGHIDAAAVVEPFATMGEGQGAKVIGHPYTAAFRKGETMAVAFSSATYLEQNKDVAERFVRALEKASADAASDPAEVRKVLVEHAGMKADVVERIKLPGYGPKLSAEAITDAATVMNKVGLLGAPLDGATLVWP